MELSVSWARQSALSRGGRRLETQLLLYDGETWNGYSYAWNEAATDAELVGRYFDPGRYATSRELAGASVLLIDDTWVSGSSAQSAAAALRRAGAAHVACVVIGRWLTPSFGGEWAPFATATRNCRSASTG